MPRAYSIPPRILMPRSDSLALGRRTIRRMYFLRPVLDSPGGWVALANGSSHSLLNSMLNISPDDWDIPELDESFSVWSVSGKKPLVCRTILSVGAVLSTFKVKAKKSHCYKKNFTIHKYKSLFDKSLKIKQPTIFIFFDARLLQENKTRKIR